jgi:dipeptidyl aminopeptidase/acylaminoacyl peptidase
VVGLKKIRLEDVHRYSAVGDVNFLPNGKEFLFVHKTIDRENNKYLSNIWSGDLSTCKVTQLTRGDKDGSPVVDPEGKSLLFTSRREKDAKGTELYLLKLGGGESRLVKTLKGGFSSISWVDEENILFTTKAAPGENPEKPVEEEPVEKRTYVIDKIPFVSNGSGFTENRISQLYRLNVATGKMKPLETVKGDVQSVEISPDRKRAAIIVKEAAERRPRWNNLYILDLKGGSPERIGDDSISVYACVWASCD